jgi:hypothetical protein
MELEWLKKTRPVARDIPPGEQRSRLPRGARACTIGCGIPKARPTTLLVCGRLTSDQNPEKNMVPLPTWFTHWWQVRLDPPQKKSIRMGGGWNTV